MSKLNWLLVGAGDIANKRVVPALMEEPRSQVVAICDLDEPRAEALAQQCDARTFTDLDAALSDSGADAVYVCTPVFLHTAQAIAALEAGKHVLVEKPPARSYPEAKTLVDAASKARGKCGVAYYRRFAPKYEMAHEMVTHGEFGQIVLIRMTYFSWFDPATDDPKYWRVVPERSGGGPVSDMGTHMIDVLVGLLGLPESIYAKAETLTHRYEVEDSCVAVFKMPDRAQGILSLHWNSKTWSHELEIIGTEAKVKWHPYDSDSVVKTVGRQIDEIATPNHPNVHYPLVEDFVTAVAEDRAPRIPPAEAAKTNLVIDALYRSARDGREVRIAEVQ